jgi:hypothetical protein
VQYVTNEKKLFVFPSNRTEAPSKISRLLSYVWALTA